MSGHRQQALSAADPDYSQHLGGRFEPHTVALLETMADQGASVLDIGANIGITAIALSQLCPDGVVVAIEPVPAALTLLELNIARSMHTNITAHNFALGNSEGDVVMQGNPTIFPARSWRTNTPFMTEATSARS